MAFAPSLQNKYTLCSSLDPAFDLPSIPELPANPTTADIEARNKASEARMHAWTVAKDTNGWAAITKPGEKPTEFNCVPIHGPRLEWLNGEVNRKSLTQGEAAMLAFRLGVVSIVNFPIKLSWLKQTPGDGFRVLDIESLQPLFDIGRDVGDPNLGSTIVLEIGAAIWERAVYGVPLS